MTEEGKYDVSVLRHSPLDGEGLRKGCTDKVFITSPLSWPFQSETVSQCKSPLAPLLHRGESRMSKKLPLFSKGDKGGFSRARANVADRNRWSFVEPINSIATRSLEGEGIRSERGASHFPPENDFTIAPPSPRRCRFDTRGKAPRIPLPPEGWSFRFHLRRIPPKSEGTYPRALCQPRDAPSSSGGRPT